MKRICHNQYRSVVNWFLFLVLLAAISPGSDQAVNEADYYAKFCAPGLEFVTPHIAWQKPGGQAPIKALFITYRGGMREITELAQRMDLDYTVVALGGRDMFFRRELESHALFSGLLTKEGLEEELARKLQDRYDLLITGPIVWDCLPLKCRYLILKKVKEGTPLLGMAKGADEYLTRASRRKVQPEFSLLLPYKGLPAFAKYQNFSGFLSNTVEMAQFGQGKIMFLKGFEAPMYHDWTPGCQTDLIETKLIKYDYYLAYVIHLINFMAGRVPPISLKGADFQTMDQSDPGLVKFTVESKKAGAVTGEFTLRDQDNRIFAQERRKITMISGENAVAFPSGSIPAGGYFADLILKDGAKVVNFGSCFLCVTSTVNIAGIDLKSDYGRNEAVSGKVLIKGNTSPSTFSLRISQKDNFGRLTAHQIFSVSNQLEIAFSLPATSPLTVIQHLEAELVRDNNMIVDRKTRFFPISDFVPRDDLRYIIWGRPQDDQGYLFLHHLGSLQQAGFDTFYAPWVYSPGHSRANLDCVYCVTLIRDSYDGNGLDYWTAKTLHREPGSQRPLDDHTRYPCLSDPHYLKQLKRDLTNCVMKAKVFTREFSMGDENFFAWGYNGYNWHELCYCTNCVASFHIFLKNEYGSLEHLNREYETAYSSFEEVKPVLLRDAQHDPKLIPLWVDYRRHMENIWAGIYRFCQETVTQVVPGARVGYEGSGIYIHSLAAVDYDKLARVFTLNNPYHHGCIPHLIRDLAQPDMLLGLGWEGGYGVNRSEILNRYFPWRNIFCGADSLWIWLADPGAGSGCGDCSILAADFSFHEYFKPYNEEVKILKDGIGKLLISAEREHDQTAIFYSASSVHAATLTKEIGLPAMDKVLHSLVPLLEDTGHRFKFVSYRQVAEEDILTREGFKYLFLPQAQAISEKEAGQIRSFVEKGGVLIADLRPGVCNEHGKPFARGILDEVFGVSQTSSAPEPIKASPVIDDASFPKQFTETVVDRSLKAVTAKARGRANDTPVFLVNEFGQGKAILLNFSLSGYAAGWPPGEEYGRGAREIKQFFKALCSFIGLKEEVRVDPEITGLRAYRFQSGALRYLGLLQKPTQENIKDSATGKLTNSLASAATVTLLEKYHIYDTRQGRHLGYTNTFETTIKTAQAQLYSFLPYKVKEVKLDVPSRVSPGQALSYTILLKADAGKPGTHIFHLVLCAPDGREVKYYTVNLKGEHGQVSGSLLLALNEKQGKWRIMVTDVATGMKTERSFIIR